MNRPLPIIPLILTFLAVAFWTRPCPAQEKSDFYGSWAFVLPDGNPAWLKVSAADSELQGRLLWSVGSARPVNEIQLQDGLLTFSRNVKWRPYGEATTKRITSPFRGVLKDGDLHLSASQIVVGDDTAAPEEINLVGRRIPPAPPKPDLSKVEFGEPIELFNGKDLAGWKLSNPKKKNGWRAEDGVLVNETPKQDFAAYGDYGNLITEREFTDFELTIEYNAPAGGNSGIYLRGMYEAQVVDRDSRMQGIQGPGAIFGRIEPARNAAHPGGEWNTYVLTLVDRHITVELNGETVIDNELLEGCTGGGIQAHDAMPGPIFLQGDHTAVQYRNIRLRPATNTSARWVHPPTEAERRATPGLVHSTIQSEVMATSMGYSIVLPPEYDESDARYPVVYWLHGGGGNECSSLFTAKAWRDPALTDAIAPVILVYPNAHRSGYMDHADGQTMVESMIMQELIPHIDQTFRTIADRKSRAVHGFSMGASGSLKFAIKYPDLFCSAVAYGGGAIDLERTTDPFLLNILERNLNRDRDLIRQNNTYHFLPQNAEKVRQNDIRFLLICGERDRWNESAVTFHQALQKQQVPCERIEVPEVGHNLRGLMVAEGATAARFQDDVFRGQE